MKSDQHNLYHEDQGLHLPCIREFLYSYFLSFRLFMSDFNHPSSFREVGMHTGEEFKHFFTSHSKLNITGSRLAYPASSVHLIFDYLTNSTIFSIIAHLLLGRSLIFVADNPNILTTIIKGLFQITEPM